MALGLRTRSVELFGLRAADGWSRDDDRDAVGVPALPQCEICASPRVGERQDIAARHVGERLRGFERHVVVGCRFRHNKWFMGAGRHFICVSCISLGVLHHSFRTGVAKASSAEGLASATALSTSVLAFLAFWQTGSFDQGLVSPPSEVLVAAVYLGLIPSALCGYLQTIAQKTVPPSSAAVVYATDPLWAAFFAYFALNERLGPAGLAGAALIAAAAFGQNLLLRDCDVEDSCDVDD